MEIVIQITALLLSLLLALFKSFRYQPSGLSEFELGQRADAGDHQAHYELSMMQLARPLAGLTVLRSVLLVSLLAVLLLGTHELWLGLLLLLAYWLLAELLAARGWLDGLAARLQQLIEPPTINLVYSARNLLNLWAPRTAAGAEPQIGSRQDIERLIANDENVLTPRQKARLLGALSLGDLTVADAMVPRTHMVTVGGSETVGPLLLDKLHQAGHKIFPVTKKNGDIQGLLYLGDIVSGHPDIKTVKDALRPSVHYIGARQPLSAVLVASLQSGRQLFIVVDDNANTQGLVTLRDALVKLMGTPPPGETYTSTDPMKVKQL